MKTLKHFITEFKMVKGKRNKKLCDLCASNERSEWAVKKIAVIQF